MQKILFLFILILSKNILGINKELKQAIEDLNFDKTELLLEKTYKSFEANDKSELNYLVKNIKSKIYGPFNIVTTTVSSILSCLGIRIVGKLTWKILTNGYIGKKTNFIFSYYTDANNIEDFFKSGQCWQYIVPLEGMPSNTINIPMIAFSALSIYVAANQIIKTIEAIKIYRLIEKYINPKHRV